MAKIDFSAIKIRVIAVKEPNHKNPYASLSVTDRRRRIIEIYRRIYSRTHSKDE